MASQAVLEITEDNFESEVMQSDVPVIVDFFADWCMPCKMLAPTLDEIAQEYEGKLKVGKIDTESNHELSTKFDVRNIPTVLLIKNGEVVDKFVGAKPKPQIVEMVDRLVD